MKAAVLCNFNMPLQIKECPIPSPGPGEVLVQVRASGLCTTDLHIQEGRISTVKLPYVPGHELAGVVKSVGEGVTRVKPGQHIIAAIDVICGHCRFCRTGRTNLCENLTRIGFERNGSHEEYVVIPEDNAFPIAEHVPFEQACIIPDAVVCMYHAMKRAGITCGSKVLILGAGGLGLQGVQIAKQFGAWVCVTSRHNEKLDIAKNLGADEGINTKTTDLQEEIVKLTGGEMLDVVFDNIGLLNTVQESMSLLRPGGKLILVGYNEKQFLVNYQDVINREKEIIGIRGSVRQDLTEVIKLVEQGKIKPFIHKTYPLEKINEALTELREGRTLGRTVIVYPDK